MGPFSFSACCSASPWGESGGPARRSRSNRCGRSGAGCSGVPSRRAERRATCWPQSLSARCTCRPTPAVVPLWSAAPSTGLIVLGVFLMQFFVQGAWGVVPAHMNELSPGGLRGFFPGFAYQLGVLCASSITFFEALLGERFSYAQAMGLLAAAVMLGGAIVIFCGPEAHGVTFRKTAERPG